MQRALQNTTTLFLLAIFCLKAGFFPVTPSEPVFPFSGQNTISPLYPPLGNIALPSHDSNSGLANFFNESLKPASKQTDTSEWYSVVLPGAANLIIPGLNITLAATGFISLSLETFLVIFPFHAFW